MRPLVLSAVLAAAAPFAGAAQAHAHLKASTPEQGSTVATPARIVLTFTEPLVARFSTFALTGPAGAAAVRVHAEGAVLTGEPAAPLAPGPYTLHWSVTATDTHHSQGDVAFSVK